MVEVFAPGLASTFEERHQAAALHGWRNRQLGPRQDRRREIDVQHQFFTHLATCRGRQARIVGDEWHADRWIVRQPLAPQAVVTMEVAIVRREDDDRIGVETKFCEQLSESAHGAVDGGHQPIVLPQLLDKRLVVFCKFQASVGSEGRPQKRWLLGGVSLRRRGRHGHGGLRIEPRDVIGGIRPWVLGPTKRDGQEKRFGRIATHEKLPRLDRHDVAVEVDGAPHAGRTDARRRPLRWAGARDLPLRRATVIGHQRAVCLVPVVAMQTIAPPEIEQPHAQLEAVLAGTHIPFANGARFVASTPQDGGVGGVYVPRRHHRHEVAHATGAWIGARQDGCPTHAAHRRSDEGVGEQRALHGQPVDVRRLNDRVAHAPERVPPLVVSEEKQDVRRPLRGGLWFPCGAGEVAAAHDQQADPETTVTRQAAESHGEMVTAAGRTGAARPGQAGCRE